MIKKNKDIKLIHTADLHLGMTFKYLGSKSKLYRRYCKEIFLEIINLCIKKRVDALLIAGDLFDSPNPSKSLVKFVIDGFKKLKGNNISVFISTGNHDPYKKDSLWAAYTFPSNVFIFDNKNIKSKIIDNLEVYGLAYINDTKEPLKDFKASKNDNFKVALIHGSTTNIKNKDDPEYSYRPINKTQIENSGLDYVALGHFHNKLEIKSKVKCFYSGAPEGLNFKNSKGSYVLIVNYQDNKVNIKPYNISKIKFVNYSVDCTKMEHDQEIRKILQKNKGQNKIFRLVLKGCPSLDFKLDINLIEEEFKSEYFFLKIKDKIHIPDNLKEDQTIRGQFIKLIKEEIKNTKDKSKIKTFENALRRGVGYLDKRL